MQPRQAVSMPEVGELLSGEAHSAQNQPPALENINLYQTDVALSEAVKREAPSTAQGPLLELGELVGSSEYIELGFKAHENRPALITHDHFGHRVDEVHYHPAYHRLMQTSFEEGLHSYHWTDAGPGAQVSRTARYYLMAQLETAHLCPVTMTSASIATLMREKQLFNQYANKVLANGYDPRNTPMEDKSSLTVGMAMTEQQGGSDVRANLTRAYPWDTSGQAKEYSLVGHKYFVSAPMSDAFLVLAQSEAGLSSFFMPRWMPDGTRNAMQIQRLKRKMGNVANATAEVELRGAYALLVGEEGRGVSNIMDMVAMTRFDCMIGSAAGMRQAVAQAVHHCAHRKAFGRPLECQRLMQNVLADLSLESEAAMALTMRIARAMDTQAENYHEKNLVRLGTILGKYWICKRAPGHAAEAMECIGGRAVMEDSIMPRLFRESPVNAIWEGCGNIQCLDLLRSLEKSPGILKSFFDEVGKVRGKNDYLDSAVQRLQQWFADKGEGEYRSRIVMENMAQIFQGAILVEHAPEEVSTAFCASRLGTRRSPMYGAMPMGAKCKLIIDRTRP